MDLESFASAGDGCCKSPIHSLGRGSSVRASMSANAFHEKAGRSQVHLFVSLLNKVFLRPSPALLSPPSHPHSWRSVFARCKLVVLVSAGAATCLATSVPPRRWKLGQAISAVTGTRRFELGVSFPRKFVKLLPAWSSDSCCARARTLLRSPTNDVVESRAFEPRR